ncbi:Fic/DOC family protein [Saccharothrix longispora]|uniref:Fic/DOC family protein n=1 Tax=Saccharothrix longispora TaxID=33920 RepID=UPI0028FD50B8|nr:Fic family protein [Saccharothrix longispora]MBY8849740.1 Fic family protein [Saccharothrix sp. MB29]MDU0294868.1 Fic family protein [Saccharothrix longispora]
MARGDLPESEPGDEAEARLSAIRIGRPEIRPLPGPCDPAHLRAFHRHVFGDPCPWAGELRRVNIARTAPFAAWQHVERYAGWLFDGLRGELYLRDLDRARFLDRFSFSFAEVNALHPFREGSGRAQRAFFGQPALGAGWRVAVAEPDPVASTAACRAGTTGPLDAPRAVSDQVLRPA